MKEYIGLDSNIDYMAEGELKAKYGFTDEFLWKFFPKPIVLQCIDPSKPSLKVWKTRDVEQLLLNKELQTAYEKINEAKDRETRTVRYFLKSYNLKTLSETVPGRDRKFILHVGPTNSGKTYNALQALKKAEKGVYLGPLRLLALEIFDTLNNDGYPCNLLTGQEYEDVQGAKLTASTIELCDFDEHYDVAVIDEAQLLSDSFRGGCWTRALFQINADTIHVCTAPEALDLIIEMINIMGSAYEIETCERKTPLVFSGVFRDLEEVQPGDALIAFSRKSVLAISATLEEQGVKTSVLYGALPPKARRSEVEKFTQGKTTVVVATDAIGMGVSLPIKRIVFCETKKFDGKNFRHLRTAEIKQIAGRAGRFGKYPIGEVLTMADPEIIQKALNVNTRKTDKFTMPFPSEVFRYSQNIEMVLYEWERLFPAELFRRKSMENELVLYKRLKKAVGGYVENEKAFKLISTPFDLNDRCLMDYWISCCSSAIFNYRLPYPKFATDTLEGCELQYQALDLRHHILRRFDSKADASEEKDKLCDKINRFLRSDKDKYLLKCSQCGKKLDFTQKFGMCEKCYNKLMMSKEERKRAVHFKSGRRRR